MLRAAGGEALKLPMVDEVRAARAAATESQAAAQDVAIAEAALRGLELAAASRSPDTVLPGAGQLRELAGRWPALAGVGEPDGLPITLSERRGRLLYVLQVLRPLAAAGAVRAATLALLLERQHEALADARYRRRTDALRRRGQALAELGRALVPAEAALVPLDVVGRMLSEWIPRARTDERRSVLLHHLASGLQPLLADLPEEIRGPFGGGDRIEDWEALSARVERRRRTVERQVERLRARRARIEAWIEARLG